MAIIPTTGVARDYQAIKTQRGVVEKKRATTLEWNSKVNTLRKEGVKHLRDLFRERGVTNPATHPSFDYYRNLLDRISHVHSRTALGEFAKILSNLTKAIGGGKGAAARFKSLLEGRFSKALERYAREYQLDKKQEEKLREMERKFLDKHPEFNLPSHRIKSRPAPFDYDSVIMDMPPIPKKSAPAAPRTCLAPCTGHGIEGKPCQVNVGNDGVCQHHGTRYPPIVIA
jgi:hypothetical protein